MKRISIIIIVIFNVLYLSAKQNLQAYYKCVATAENFIMSEKYDSAAIYYENAFKNKDFPFGWDLTNAAFCESKLPQPSFERCKYYIENGISKWYLKKKLEMDTTLFKDIVLVTYFKKELFDTIREMLNQDQLYRSSTDRQEMRNIDLQNIEIYKELLKTTDMLNERIARSCLGDLGTLFTHWLDYPDFRKFIQPKMLKAVLDGRYDARLFAEQMDYAIYRDNGFGGNTLLSPYGTYLLNLFVFDADQNDYENYKYFAYFDFDKDNKKEIKAIKNINKNREKIYLGEIVESAIRGFNLFVFRAAKYEIPYPFNAPAICIQKYIEGKSFLYEKIEQQPNLIYYISGEHDFNLE
jgi:hypothetical protein